MPAGKKLVSHFRVSRKSVTSPQTDRRVTNDGPSVKSTSTLMLIYPIPTHVYFRLL